MAVLGHPVLLRQEEFSHLVSDHLDPEAILVHLETPDQLLDGQGFEIK